jgi:hypothetical protein
MDVWHDLEPNVCKPNPKGYSLKLEGYMPVLAAETATGMAAILGATLYLTHKKGMSGQLEQLAKSEPNELEEEAALAVRRYLYGLKGEWYGDLPLFEPDGVS